MRESLIANERADTRDDKRAYDGHYTDKAIITHRAFDKAPGVNKEQADAGQCGGESDAEGDDEREAVADATERNRGKQDDERRRTRQQAARNTKRKQAATRDGAAVGSRRVRCSYRCEREQAEDKDERRNDSAPMRTYCR